MVKYVPFKAPYEHILPRLLDVGSASHVSAKDAYDRLPPDQLNWRIITNVSAKQVTHAILRNRTKRRYYAAFSLALKEQGYHANGKLLRGSDNGNEGNEDALDAGHGPQQPLKGTLEIYVFHNKANDMGFDRLRTDAALVVDALRRHQHQHQHQQAGNKLQQPRQDRLFKKVVPKQRTNNLFQQNQKQKTNDFSQTRRK